VIASCNKAVLEMFFLPFSHVQLINFDLPFLPILSNSTIFLAKDEENKNQNKSQLNDYDKQVCKSGLGSQHQPV
jgi:hypothetical protein